MKKLSFKNNRYWKDLRAAKRKKKLVDMYDCTISGGIHRFMKNNLSALRTAKSSRKARAYMKKYYNSLNEDKLNMQTDAMLYDWFLGEDDFIAEEILPNE